jgi:hypothetical protein
LKLDASSLILFCLTLTGTIGVILAVTIFARWLRTKLVWTPLGRFLCRIGLSRANGTIDDLRKGRRYIVTKSFADYYGGQFQVGERLTFLGWDFHPYHGGYLIQFEEREIYLQEEENAEVLQRLWMYIEPAPD